MTGLELLDEHPKAAIVVKQWYLDKMLESLKDESLPEDFKEHVRQQGIDNSTIAKMIDGMPRTLFDVFDNNKVFIQINVSPNFSYSINEGDVISGSWKTRREAEIAAIEQAFKLLNDKL